MGPRALTDTVGLKKEIADLKVSRLYRRPPVIEKLEGSRLALDGRPLSNFSSNDYLGLSRHPFVVRRSREALVRWGAGSGASRFLSGNLKIHAELESRLARFKSEESCRVFSSGYLANLGAVTALVGDKDLVIADRFDHASLIDAARLSKAKFWVYPHRDVDSLRNLLSQASGFRRRLVMTDGYFSMDGDVSPLDRILELCRRYDAFLMVDEAHSTGVFGPRGRGLTERFGIENEVDVVMGTLSKALGSVGGFVTGKKLLTEILTNRAKEFIYTTAPAPAASAAALAALGLVENKPAILKKLWANIRRIREGLSALGFDLMASEGPIVPVFVGESKKTLKIQTVLTKEGVFAPAIRPPTVPRGGDRIRLSVTAEHEDGDLENLLEAFKKVRPLFR